MKTTIDYLDAVKVKLQLPSDYAAAKALGVTKASISKYRVGKTSFDAKTAVVVAQILDVDPLRIISDTNLERARDEKTRTFWEKFSKGFWRLAHPAKAYGACLR
jgi:transcriptional regulator with XRE-family HTH domain